MSWVYAGVRGCHGCVQGSEADLEKSVLSSHHVAPRYRIHVVMFDAKGLCLPSHLAGSSCRSFSYAWAVSSVH